MYVIKYDMDIYAGTYNDMDGCYLYPSSYFNMQKPKVFKALKGAEKHLSNLKNKVVFGKNADVYNFKIIEWSENDLESHLMSIGVKPGKNDDPQNSNTISPDKKLEKYWKKVFKPLKNEEIEITNITVSDNVCTINYLMPYCTSSEEYIFQADIDKEKAVGGFCNTVEEKANEMISRAELLAKEIRLGSIEYAEDVLTTVEHNLKSILQEVERNRIELNPGK